MREAIVSISKGFSSKGLGSKGLGSKGLLCAVVWLGTLALAAAQTAGAPADSGAGAQPICKYGYYGYAPYACAPHGFYGPDYFYNGIFVGVGPWADWGYTHGWGEHRFNRGVGRAAAANPAADSPAAAVAPVVPVRHETPVAAAHGAAPSSASSSASSSAHSGAAAVRPSETVAHSGAAAAHAGHGAAAVTSHGTASVEGTHAAVGRGGVATHPSSTASHPNVVAGHASSVAHPGAAHGGSSATHPGTYHVPAPTTTGQYHPPPP